MRDKIEKKIEESETVKKVMEQFRPSDEHRDAMRPSKLIMMNEKSQGFKSALEWHRESGYNKTPIRLCLTCGEMCDIDADNSGFSFQSSDHGMFAGRRWGGR